MGVGDETRPDQERPDGKLSVGVPLSRKLEFRTGVVVVQFDASRHLRDIVMESKFFLSALLIFDDEGIIETEIVDVLPLLLQLRPDSRPQVVLEHIKKPWADLRERKLMTRNRVIGMLVKSPTRFSRANQRGTELTCEEAHNHHLCCDDAQR